MSATTQQPNIYSIPYEVLERLSEELTESDGNIDTEIEDGEMLVAFKGWYEIYGATEDDYYNGTGASYLTHASVSLTCTVYDAEGDEVANDYIDRELEKHLLN